MSTLPSYRPGRHAFFSRFGGRRDEDIAGRNQDRLVKRSIRLYGVRDFNNITGAISNVISVNTTYSNTGLPFPPMVQKLYVTILSTVLQFDATPYPNTAALEASSFQLISLVPNIKYYGMRTGPDHKIYVLTTTSQSPKSPVICQKTSASLIIRM